jgi:hypothetical protein
MVDTVAESEAQTTRTVIPGSIRAAITTLTPTKPIKKPHLKTKKPESGLFQG